jgi:hypothetical protein
MSTKFAARCPSALANESSRCHALKAFRRRARLLRPRGLPWTATAPAAWKEPLRQDHVLVFAQIDGQNDSVDVDAPRSTRERAQGRQETGRRKPRQSGELSASALCGMPAFRDSTTHRPSSRQRPRQASLCVRGLRGRWTTAHTVESCCRLSGTLSARSASTSWISLRRNRRRIERLGAWPRLSPLPLRPPGTTPGTSRWFARTAAWKRRQDTSPFTKTSGP